MFNENGNRNDEVFKSEKITTISDNDIVTDWLS